MNIKRIIKEAIVELNKEQKDILYLDDFRISDSAVKVMKQAVNDIVKNVTKMSMQFIDCKTLKSRHIAEVFEKRMIQPYIEQIMPFFGVMRKRKKIAFYKPKQAKKEFKLSDAEDFDDLSQYVLLKKDKWRDLRKKGIV